jgi:hypothetical protein
MSGYDNDDNDDNSDNDDHLDTSWIQQEERLQLIQNNLSREPMDSIHGIFIYINQNNYIDKIVRENIQLTEGDNGSGSQIQYDSLLKIIQSKKVTTPVSKYKFANLYSFMVDLDPDHIQPFSNLNDDDDQLTNSSFFKEQNITDPVKIPSSIFVFHNTNTLYFFFQEVITTKHNTTLKSILKTEKNKESREPDNSSGHTKTKKNVRIFDKLDTHISNLKKMRNKGTRKRRT